MARTKPLARAKPQRRSAAPDWEAIRREYRAGQLSIAEIARRFELSRKAIQKRAAKEGWARDLTDDIRAAAAAKVHRRLASQGSQGVKVAGKVAPPASRARASDAQIVEGSSDRTADVVFEHLARTDGLKTTFAVLHYQLDRMIGVERPPPALPAGVSLAEMAPQVALLQGKGDSVSSHARALGDLAERIQRLDRQSLNLDADDGRGLGAPPLILETDLH